MGGARYADSGVDIGEGNRAVELIRETVQATHGPAVLRGLGGFGGMFALDIGNSRRPVLVSSTDSVGTKVKIAIATGCHRGIGVDLVNHCVNDILCCGAEPLFFLDYYATGQLHAEQLADIVDGMAGACRATGTALIGGETAELPSLYAVGDYDVAGFIVGVVERDELIDGGSVRAGDLVLGMPSSGLHTNGYSLVRHIAAEHGLEWDEVLPGTTAPLVDLLLEPHRCYLDAIRELRTLIEIRAIAHITGGGLIENVPRVLPPGLGIELDRGAWQVPALFGALQRAGGIDPEDMWRTFNMGVGMVAIVPAGAAPPDRLGELPLWKLGSVVEASSQRVGFV